MKSLIAAAVVLCLTSGPAIAQVRDNRTAPPVPAPVGTASISGTVVAADDNHPLALANVVVIGAITGTLKLTTTDRNGQFSFAKLAADRYVVAASKPPYIGAVAGARRAARPGSPIVVGADQNVSGVKVALPRGAVVAGTILDDRGKPLQNATVVLRQWKMQGDERVLATPVGTTAASTDASGRYRLYGIPPGEYLVSASRPISIPVRAVTDKEIDQLLDGKPVDLTIDRTLRAVPTYFPGTPRPVEATPVVVNAGDQRLGIDFQIDFVRAARVEGFVVGPDGQPVTTPNLRVTMATAGGMLFGSTTVTETPGGRFSFPPTIPGPQVLTVTTGTPANPLVATATFDTSAGDQLGLQLTLHPAQSIMGQLVFDGGTAPVAGHVVPVRNFGRTADFGPPLGATIARDTGEFKLDRVLPGRYLIGGAMISGPASDSATWSLKSVIADDKDITDKVLEIGADSAPKNIVVTYTNQWQQLSGKLTHASGASATDETMIVFPADRAYWYQGSRRIATSRPGTDGLFSFGGPGPTSLPPGDYLLAAVTDLGRDEQFDPSFLAALVQAAAPVTIGAGEKKVQDLVIR
jgi:protocatechuate 3,4-dioxygenase beta subunit